MNESPAHPPSLVQSVVEIALEAGRRIMQLYDADHDVELKGDNSPLTIADRESHELIVEALHHLTPSTLVISEESTTPLEAAGDHHEFWLVDPLDGTKEFIKRTGEFTVNIALVTDRFPRLGVVHAPAIGVTYFAEQGCGAFVTRSGETTRIQSRSDFKESMRVALSRDHIGPREQSLLDRLGHVETVSMGSSLKFCMVAEGTADLYPRFVPTMEWDTAAAQIVVEEAGGRITDSDGTRLIYDKRPLRNPPLLTVANDQILETIRPLID